jgi:hypothetical protein
VVRRKRQDSSNYRNSLPSFVIYRTEGQKKVAAEYKQPIEVPNLVS